MFPFTQFLAAACRKQTDTHYGSLFVPKYRRRGSLKAFLIFHFPCHTVFVPQAGVRLCRGGKCASTVLHYTVDSWKIVLERILTNHPNMFWSKRRVISDGLSWCIDVLISSIVFLVPNMISNLLGFFQWAQSWYLLLCVNPSSISCMFSHFILD